MTEPTLLLDRLIGLECSSVEFVRDCPQLRFDGPTLSVYQMPIVQMGKVAYQQGQPGYLEAIVAVIGETVTEAEWHRGSDLAILFGIDRRLVFPAVEKSETAVLTLPDRQWNFF